MLCTGIQHQLEEKVYLGCEDMGKVLHLPKYSEKWMILDNYHKTLQILHNLFYNLIHIVNLNL